MAAVGEFDIVKNKKGKAAVWKHFGLVQKSGEKDVKENVAACTVCKAVVKCSGGTTNLTCHLRRHHPALLTNVTSDCQKGTDTPLKSPFQYPRQKSIVNAFACSTKYSNSSAKATTITDKIGRLIVKDMRPYSMVESKEFRDLVTELDPRYQVPSRKTISEIVIPNMYTKVYGDVKKSLSEVEMVSLTTDGWSSRATESYMTITSSHINEAWELVSYVLQTRALPESHTGEHVAAVLQAAVTEWNIPTNQTSPMNPPLVSDNASNMIKAAQSFNTKVHVPCYAHTLNLAAQKCLKVKRVSHILARMRKIVAFFHKSNIATDILKKKAEGLGLPQHKLTIDVPTRWNSAYDMVSRFLEMQVAVFATLRSKEVGKNKDTDMKSFSDEDLIVAEEMIQVLKPLKDITTLLCSEKLPTASLIMPLQHRLTNIVFLPKEDDSTAIKDMKNVLLHDFEGRYKEHNEILNMCTALDPRFKQLPYLAEEARFTTFNNLIQEVASVHTIVKLKQEPGIETVTINETDPPLPNLPQLNLPPTLPLEIHEHETPKAPSPKKFKLETDYDSIFGDVYICGHEPPKTPHELAEKQILLYRECPPISLHQDPLKGWKDNEYKGFPMVARVAKMLLSIPATSVPSERVFSTAGDILNAQRANLKAKHVDRLIFLKKNMK